MISRPAPADARLDRHRVVRLRPQGWAALVGASEDLRREPFLEGWARRGWPFIVRRARPEDAGGVPLGLPLPPCLGRGRLSLRVDRAEIVSDEPPPSLADCRAVAPVSWRPALDAILAAGARHGTAVRCFGSLAWANLTGLPYLLPESDLDLLLFPRDLGETAALAADLTGLQSGAPMRLDGEIVRPDGISANWREVAAGSPEVLVKWRAGVALWTRGRFLKASP